MPAITRWSRSSGCRWRGTRTRSASSSRGGTGSASGPRVATASSASTEASGSSFAHARCWVPNSRSRSSRSPGRRISSRDALSRSDARLSKTCSRPADMRWISSASSPSNSTTGIFPRRDTAVIVRPASESSGGSNVFMVTMPGASADSTTSPTTARAMRLTVISTSGSSGMLPASVPTVSGTALILGARNLGRAIGEHLAGAGWNVAGVARSQDTADALAEAVPEALAITLDASEPDAIDEAVRRTRERFGGRIDLHVNAIAAGPSPSGAPFGGGPIADASPEDFDHYALSVARQTYAFLHGSARAAREDGGATIVQITGGSSQRAIPGRGAWAAGAFATRALAQSAALELRDEGIHVVLLVVDATIRSPKTAAYIKDAGPNDVAEQED